MAFPSRTPHVLMCPPTYFEVSYSINPAMKKTLENKQKVDPVKAEEQWTRLRDIYIKEGFEIDIVEPVKGLPDMVFTANCGIVYESRAVIGTFKNWQRQPETEYFIKWFKENEYGVVPIREVFEGTGDMLLWQKKIIGGHGIRSNLDGVRKAAKFMTILGREKDLVLVKLVDERYYHLDTCFCPMGDSALFYPKAFSADSIDILQKMGARPVSDEDAAHMVCNGVYLDNGRAPKFIVNDIGAELRKWMEGLGIEIILNPTSEFQLSGGSNRCLTLFL